MSDRFKVEPTGGNAKYAGYAVVDTKPPVQYPGHTHTIGDRFDSYYANKIVDALNLAEWIDAPPKYTAPHEVPTDAR